MQTLRRRFTLTCLVITLAACCQAPQKPIKKRDTAMRQLFLSQNACPSTGKNKGACPGYVVDHIVPIKRGGGDNPYNMQWQTIIDAKDKDRWE
jgi:5-methylcytosine-specific restriction endonuclease McrA